MMSYATIETLHQIPSTIHNENFVVHMFSLSFYISLGAMFNLVFNEHPF